MMLSLIGIDIGGTKTHGVRFKDGQVIHEVVTGSANVQNVDVATAAANLEELLQRLNASEVDEIWAGAGGIDTSDDAVALAALIGRFAPSARISVVHDSRLLLAAGNASTGVAVISGTGSAVWGVNEEGDEVRYGGWGFLLGDEGSGYWLGREAVRHSLQIANESKVPDVLARSLLAHCGVSTAEELIALCHSTNSPRHLLAGMARTVITAAERGDGVSRALLSAAGHHLAHLATAAVTHLQIDGPIILGGGIGTNSLQVQHAFRESMATHGITDVHVLTRPPAYGAQELACDRPPKRNSPKDRQGHANV